MSILVYFLLFVLPVAGLSLSRVPWNALDKALWLLVGAIFILAVGLRDHVGGDWATYQLMVEIARTLPFTSAVNVTDPGYALLNWLSSRMTGTAHLANFISAVIAVVPLMIFCRSRGQPWLSLAVSVPYLVVVVYMGYTRQSAAIGLCMLAILLTERGLRWNALGLAMLAGTFHRVAGGFLLPLIALNAVPPSKINLTRALLAACASAAYLWIFVLLPGGVEERVGSYLLAPTEANALAPGAGSASGFPPPINSAGAIPRLALGLLAGLAYFWVKRRAALFSIENGIWTLCAIGSFVLFPLALITSTFADRIGLFLIPLQLHVVSLADAEFKQPTARLFFRVSVLSGYAAMLLIWLWRSDHAQNWLPYENLIFSNL